jgi:hypothetical protein
MAKGYRDESSQLIVIPAIPLLQKRLAVIKAEEKRIKVLLRAAKKLAEIEVNARAEE